MRKDSTLGLAVREVPGLVCVPGERQCLPKHLGFYRACEGNWLCLETPAAQLCGPWACEVLALWVGRGSCSWEQPVGHEKREPLSQPTCGPDRSGSLGDMAPHVPLVMDGWLGTRRVGGIKRNSEVITDTLTAPAKPQTAFPSGPCELCPPQGFARETDLRTSSRSWLGPYCPAQECLAWHIPPPSAGPACPSSGKGPSLACTRPCQASHPHTFPGWILRQGPITVGEENDRYLSPAVSHGEKNKGWEIKSLRGKSRVCSSERAPGWLAASFVWF